MVIKYFLSSLFLISCSGRQIQDNINSKDIIRIEIINETNNRNIPDKIELIESPAIKSVVNEINNIHAAGNNPILKANFGYYSMQLQFKNKSYKRFDIIYTTYDGVIIQGSDGIFMNKSFKNDNLELLILS